MRNIEGGGQSQKSLEISRSLLKSLDLIPKVFQEEESIEGGPAGGNGQETGRDF